MSEFTQIGKLLLLLFIANGSPGAAKRILGSRYSYPIDAGRSYRDGAPVFGASKTYRGLVASILTTMIAALLVGETAFVGFVISATSMAGDLLSSFTKRRLGLPPSSPVLGLDHIPEALLPAIVVMPLLGLSPADVVIVTGLFFVGAIVSSRLLYRIGLRENRN